MLLGNRIGLFVLAVAMLGCASAGEPTDTAVAGAEQALSASSISFDVKLRESATVSIHAAIYRNPWRVFGGETGLAVHGLTETGFTYEPLAAALFARPAYRSIGRIVAIDMPGHGESGFPQGLPEGVKFGDLSIDDNVSVVLQSISALAQRGLAPHTIIGHSMGGLAVQAAQEALLSKGSSLAQVGIQRALLLAPVPPHGRPWTVPPSADLSQVTVQDPVLGTYLKFPAALFIAQSFTTTSGQLASDAPTPDEVDQAGYVGPEPLLTLLQLVEAPFTLPSGAPQTLSRPSVRAGAFAANRGTQLTLAAFTEDTLVHADDLAALFPYLAGDDQTRGFVRVTAPDAVHAMFISNPRGLLRALTGQ
jgi:pimeloyl-ACP methyl ester carboxylesterase